MIVRTVVMPLLALLAVLSPLTASAQPERYVEGQHYQELARPDTRRDADRIEVVEVFWYGCPACFGFEPYIDRWVENKPDDVVFTRLPTGLGRPDGRLQVQAYFAAEELGVKSEVHAAIFRTLHVDRRPLASVDALYRLFEAAGVSRADFDAAFEGYEVDTKVRAAEQRIRKYAVNSVPTVIVDGRWRVLGRSGNEEMLRIISFLVDKARAERR